MVFLLQQPNGLRQVSFKNRNKNAMDIGVKKEDLQQQLLAFTKFMYSFSWAHWLPCS